MECNVCKESTNHAATKRLWPRVSVFRFGAQFSPSFSRSWVPTDRNASPCLFCPGKRFLITCCFSLVYSAYWNHLIELSCAESSKFITCHTLLIGTPDLYFYVWGFILRYVYYYVQRCITYVFAYPWHHSCKSWRSAASGAIVPVA